MVCGNSRQCYTVLQEILFPLVISIQRRKDTLSPIHIVLLQPRSCYQNRLEGSY